MQIIYSNGRNKIKLTNMRTVSGVKVGSQKVRNEIAQDVKLSRRLLITSEKIGNVICQRIATPRAHVKETHLIAGNERTKSGKRVALSKVVPNPLAGMMKTSPRAHGNFPSRLVTRRDIVLSHHDREDIKSTVRTVLAISLEPDGYIFLDGERMDVPQWRKGEKLPKAVWRVLFKACRDTLGMHKVMSREESYNAPGMEPLLNSVVDLASDSLEASLAEDARLARIAKLGEHFRECIRATFYTDKSRKRLAAFKGMMAFCYLAEGCAMGKAGHGLDNVEQTRIASKRFLAYVAKGEELLNMNPQRIKAELETAFTERAIE